MLSVEDGSVTEGELRAVGKSPAVRERDNGQTELAGWLAYLWDRRRVKSSRQADLNRRSRSSLHRSEKPGILSQNEKMTSIEEVRRL